MVNGEPVVQIPDGAKWLQAPQMVRANMNGGGQRGVGATLTRLGQYLLCTDMETAVQEFVTVPVLCKFEERCGYTGAANHVAAWW